MADLAERTSEFDIKIAADSIDKLRSIDVYRVLDSVDSSRRPGLAAFIKEHRPDLAGEVDNCLADLEPGKVGVCISGSQAVDGVCGEPNCVCAKKTERLFAGIFPNAIGYADRFVEVNGDYKTLANLYLDNLELRIEDDCPADLRAEIESDAARYQNRAGEQFRISHCGQTVILGSALLATAAKTGK